MSKKQYGHPAALRGNMSGGRILDAGASKIAMAQRAAPAQAQRQVQPAERAIGAGRGSIGRGAIRAIADEMGTKPSVLKAAWKLSMAGFRDVETDPKPIEFALSGAPTVDVDGFGTMDDTQTVTLVIKTTSYNKWAGGIEVSAAAVGADDDAIVKLVVKGLGPSDVPYNIGKEPRLIEVNDWLDSDIQFVFTCKSSSDAAPVNVLLSGMCGLPGDDDDEE